MEQQKVLEILGQVGAVIKDSHIVYTSGRHGNAYVNKDAVYPHTRYIGQLCWEMAREWVNDHVQAVVGPVVGGVILSQWVSSHLTQLAGPEVLATFAEKDEDKFVIKRGYDRLIKGMNVLVVEDVLTTGGSVRKVIDAVRAAGGHVVGVSALCNRGGIKASDIGSPPRLHSLVDINLDSWGKAECPLCKEGVSINTDVGKGREFLARKSG